MAINRLLTAFAARIAPLNVNYAFRLWRGDAVYPYWVADVSATTHAYEDGSTTGRITLQGWTRGDMQTFLAEAQRIARQFNGYTEAENGFGCAIDYAAMQNVPQADIELKSVIMYFDFKTWEV